MNRNKHMYLFLNMAAEDLDVLLQCMAENENYEKYYHDIVENIQMGKKQFFSVIEGLETQLTSTDVNARLKGIEILVKLLETLPKDLLKEDEIIHITGFLCGKLKDHHSLIPIILRGLYTIIIMDHVLPSCLRQIIDSLSVDVQNHVQTPKDRLVIYEILATLLSRKLTVLQEMGTVFVFAVIGLVDSECNAKNLKYIFTFLPLLLRNFKLEHLAEDMFEAIACYFPIDVPTQGKEVVSREELSKLLENCLTSNAELAKFTLPLLIEKLDSDLRIAKLDSLSLLLRACDNSVWGATELQPFLRDLGFSLQREANSKDNISGMSLMAITAIVKCLSSSKISKEQAPLLQNFVQHLTEMNQHALLQVEKQGFVSASAIVTALARGTLAAAVMVCDAVIPTLVSQYQTRSGNHKEQAVILAALSNLQATLHDTSELKKYSCSSLYFEAALSMQHTDLRQKAFQGVCTVASVLSEEERANIYKLLESALLDENIEHANSCFNVLAQLYSEEVLKTELFENLFHHQGTEAELAVQSLCSLCITSTSQFIPSVVPRIVGMAIGSQLAQKKAALNGLQLLAQSSSCAFLCSPCNVIQKLCHHWLSSEIKSPNMNTLNLTADVLTFVLRRQDTQYQNFILKECWSSLGLNVLESGDSNVQVFTTIEKALLGLSLLGSLRSEIDIPHRETLICALLNTALTSDDPQVRESCGHLAANLVNKAPPDFDCDTVLSYVSQRIIQTPASGLTLFMRLTRALLLRGSTKFDDWMLKIINYLSDPELGVMTAQAFPLLVSDENNFLSSENHAIVRFLHKQRLSQYLPKLHEVHSTAVTSTVSNLLLAITHILQVAPKAALEPYFPQLIPLLICSLQADQRTSAVLASLQCLEPMLKEQSPYLTSHLSDLIKPCLHLGSQHPNMKVRIAALECIAYIPMYEYNPEFVAMKCDVLESLKLALDDRKRLVRRAAVMANGRWHLFGASET